MKHSAIFALCQPYTTLEQAAKETRIFIADLQANPLERQFAGLEQAFALGRAGIGETSSEAIGEPKPCLELAQEQNAAIAKAAYARPPRAFREAAHCSGPSVAAAGSLYHIPASQ